MGHSIITPAGPPSPAACVLTTGTTRPLLGPPREMSVLELADARCRYSALQAGGVRGLDWYDAARRSGMGPHSALAEARWHAVRERRAVAA